MKFLKNPMTNALFIAFISAIYSMIFIVSSEFTPQYDKFLSNSSWAMFIRNGSMKYIGLGILAIVIMIDSVSACKRKKLDEYQTTILEKILIFNGIVGVYSTFFNNISNNSILLCRNNFCVHNLAMDTNYFT